MEKIKFIEALSVAEFKAQQGVEKLEEKPPPKLASASLSMVERQEQ